MTIKRGLQNKFNRGEVAKEAFAREDVTPIDNSCETLLNFLPARLGTMQFRPGSQFIENATAANARLIPFVSTIADAAILEFSENAGVFKMKVIRNDAFIARTSVSSSMQNQQFSTGFTAGEWVDNDEDASAVSLISGGFLTQTGAGLFAAIAFQTLDATQTGQPHGFKIRVTVGIVRLKLGTTGVSSGNLFDQELPQGIHHIVVTPAAALTVTFINDRNVTSGVDYCELLGAADIEFNIEEALNVTPDFTGGFTSIRSMQFAQSADVMYFCGKDLIPFMVKRWSPTAFTLQRFENSFGPYEPINISTTTMDMSAISGVVSVTASKDYWLDQIDFFGYSEGVIMRISTTGQTQTATGNDDTLETLGIFVFGTGDARKFRSAITTTGSYNEIILEKSFDEISWQTAKSYTGGGNISEIFNDSLDGADIFYRLQVEDIGAATSVTLTLTYDYGTIDAHIRFTAEPTSTVISSAYVYSPAGSDDPSRDWNIGSWGGKNPYPTACAFHEGRLWFAGRNKIWGSESDFYASFDRTIEGASASIERTIGFGPSEDILWLAPSARLVCGTPGAEIDVRSTTFGEVLTDLNTNLKAGSNLGCAQVSPIVLDQEIIFVQRGGDKLISIDFSLQQEKHSIEDFNTLNPTILNEQVVSMAYSRNPETRIYIVMADGTMRVLLRDQGESVLGWSRITIAAGGSARTIIDVAVLPATGGDEVFIVTAEGGNTYIEKFAQLDEAIGGSRSQHFDNHLSLTSPGSTIALAHLVNGTTVGVWVDGADDGDKVISGGQITGVTSGTDVVVGLKYVADYLSNKVSGYDDAAVINSRKRIINTSLIMTNYVTGVLSIGSSLAAADLKKMPLIERGKPVVVGTEDYDEFPFPYSGTSETDPRLALRATGPCTIMALAYDVKNTSIKTPDTPQTSQVA